MHASLLASSAEVSEHVISGTPKDTGSRFAQSIDDMEALLTMGAWNLTLPAPSPVMGVSGMFVAGPP